MLSIPVPPPPQLSDQLSQTVQYACFGGGAVVGIVLLLWGRNVGRIMLTLVGMGVGYLTGATIAGALGADPVLGQVMAAVTFGVICLLTARLIWALLTTMLFETLAIFLLMRHFMNDVAAKAAPTFGDAGSFPTWLAALGNYLWASFQILRETNMGTVLLVAVPVGLLPLMVTLLRPRLSVIFATALLGGAMLTTSLWLLAVRLRPGLWPEDWWRFLIPAGVVVVMAIIGWVYQGHGEVEAMRRRQQAKDKPPPDVKPPAVKPPPLPKDAKKS